MLRMEERKELDAKQAEMQRAVISRTQTHMAQELARMNGAACPPSGCGGTEAGDGNIPSAAPVTEREYRQDFAQAEGIEAERRAAFLANARALHAKVKLESPIILSRENG